MLFSFIIFDLEAVRIGIPNCESKNYKKKNFQSRNVFYSKAKILNLYISLSVHSNTFFLFYTTDFKRYIKLHILYKMYFV
jgi:hypothetical protein